MYIYFSWKAKLLNYAFKTFIYLLTYISLSPADTLKVHFQYISKRKKSRNAHSVVSDNTIHLPTYR